MRTLAHRARLARARTLRVALAALAASALLLALPAEAGSVYRWVDANGVTHLSSEKPPAGVKFERLSVSTYKSSATRTASSGKATTSNTRLAAVSPEQLERRNAVIDELQTRECVHALEAMDRLSRGGQPVDPAEFKRLQQTADRNCSEDPTTRRKQEDMAAKLRVSRSDPCVRARNELAALLQPGRKPTRAQLKAQQEFIEAHCEAPVR